MAEQKRSNDTPSLKPGATKGEEAQRHGQRKGPEEARMQGHWLMASLGKKVLRPGGLELTDQILNRLAVNHDSDIVEFGPGLGHTASRLLKHLPRSYTAVDRNPYELAANSMKDLLKQYPHAKYVVADAKSTGLPDQCANLVIGEALLTMQPEKGKRAIMEEAARLLRPGGVYAIHELAFVPDDCLQSLQDRVAEQLRKSIKVGARPLTPKIWGEYLAAAGFEVRWIGTAPMALLESRRLFADEGIVGAAKFIFNVLRNKPARERILKMRKVFRENASFMAGVGVVAIKK